MRPRLGESRRGSEKEGMGSSEIKKVKQNVLRDRER